MTSMFEALFVRFFKTCEADAEMPSIISSLLSLLGSATESFTFDDDGDGEVSHAELASAGWPKSNVLLYYADEDGDHAISKLEYKFFFVRLFYVANLVYIITHVYWQQIHSTRTLPDCPSSKLPGKPVPIDELKRLATSTRSLGKLPIFLNPAEDFDNTIERVYIQEYERGLELTVVYLNETRPDPFSDLFYKALRLISYGRFADVETIFVVCAEPPVAGAAADEPWRLTDADGNFDASKPAYIVFPDCYSPDMAGTPLSRRLFGAARVCGPQTWGTYFPLHGPFEVVPLRKFGTAPVGQSKLPLVYNTTWNHLMAERPTLPPEPELLLDYFYPLSPSASAMAKHRPNIQPHIYPTFYGSRDDVDQRFDGLAKPKGFFRHASKFPGLTRMLGAPRRESDAVPPPDVRRACIVVRTAIYATLLALVLLGVASASVFLCTYLVIAILVTMHVTNKAGGARGCGALGLFALIGVTSLVSPIAVLAELAFVMLFLYLAIEK